MRRRSTLEAYLVLFTTTEQNLADHTCAALEEAQIPVMLEHVELIDSGGRTSGYRVLVPSGMSQAAMKLVTEHPYHDSSNEMTVEMATEGPGQDPFSSDLPPTEMLSAEALWQRTRLQ